MGRLAWFAVACVNLGVLARRYRSDPRVALCIREPAGCKALSGSCAATHGRNEIAGWLEVWRGRAIQNDHLIGSVYERQARLKRFCAQHPTETLRE